VPQAVQAVSGLTSGVGSFLGPVGAITSVINGANSFLNKPKKPAIPGPAQAAPFSPKKPGAMALPSSLSEYADFTPEQQRSAFATKGINQGLGKDEDSYYKNLIQQSLIGDNNQITGDMNSLLPVESQYFSQQGINTSDIMKFLEQISGGQ